MTFLRTHAVHSAWGADPQNLPPDEPVKSEPPCPLMREISPGEPFPVHALGPVLRPMAEAIHDRVQAPMAICAQSVLAVAALAVQGHVDVVLPIGETKPTSLYLITQAESGERKDASDNVAMRPVARRQKALRDQYDIDHPQWQDERAMWDRLREKIFRENRKDRAAMRADLQALGPMPPEPLDPLLVCSEPTFEGLCKLYGRGQPSLGLFTTEGGRFIGGHGMTEEAKLRTATGLSKFWDGAPVDRVRALEGTLYLEGRRLSLHLMVQPRVGDLLLRDGLLIDQGLASRLLVSAPESAAGTRLSHELQPTTGPAIAQYCAHLLHILEKPLTLVHGKRQELAPRGLPFDHQATSRYFEFVDHVELRLGKGGELAPIKGFGNKLPEHAGRLAGVLRAVEDLDAAAASEADFANGIILAEHYAAEALRLNEGARIRAKLRQAQQLLDWLHDEWMEEYVSLPDIYQRGPYAIRDQATARGLVHELEEHGWAVRVVQGAVVAGQRRREAWRIVKRG